MTVHRHDPGHAHPSPWLPPSLILMSLAGRLSAVGALAIVIWTLVWWATR